VSPGLRGIGNNSIEAASGLTSGVRRVGCNDHQRRSELVTDSPILQPDSTTGPPIQHVAGRDPCYSRDAPVSDTAHGGGPGHRIQTAVEATCPG